MHRQIFVVYTGTVLIVRLWVIIANNTRCNGKGKSVPLQARRGPEGSRKLRFPNFMTTAQDGGKVVNIYPQEMLLVFISLRS